MTTGYEQVLGLCPHWVHALSCWLSQSRKKCGGWQGNHCFCSHLYSETFLWFTRNVKPLIWHRLVILDWFSISSLSGTEIVIYTDSTFLLLNTILLYEGICHRRPIILFRLYCLAGQVSLFCPLSLQTLSPLKSLSKLSDTSSFYLQRKKSRLHQGVDGWGYEAATRVLMLGRQDSERGRIFPQSWLTFYMCKYLNYRWNFQNSQPKADLPCFSEAGSTIHNGLGMLACLVS